VKLFGKKQTAESSGGEQVPGLADLAAARGWQPVDGEPLRDMADQVHRLAWVLHDRRYSSLYDPTSVEHRTLYRDAYAGEADGHGIVVANAWTNIGPQQVVRLLEGRAIAICAVERCKFPPLLIQPSRLPLLSKHIATTSTGDAEFDARFVTQAPLPGTAELVSDDVRHRILAHDDWAFVGAPGTLLCASTGPFESADAVAARVEEVLGVVAAFEAGAVPTPADPETAALLDRVARIASLDDALAFLLGLTAHERELLARSDTPLAAFANVTTPDQALEQLQTLDVAQRLRLFAMMDLTDEQ